MLHARWMLAGAVLLLAIMVLAPQAVYAKEEAAAKVELPDAVVAAVNAAFPNAKIEKVKLEDENGVKVYEVELEQGETEIEIEIAPDGTIIEIETEIKMADVPEAAAKAIQAAAEGAKIEEVKKVEKRAEIKKVESGTAIVALATPIITYEAELETGDQEGEIEVAADGAVVEALKWKAKEKEEGEHKDEAKK